MKLCLCIWVCVDVCDCVCVFLWSECKIDQADLQIGYLSYYLNSLRKSALIEPWKDNDLDVNALIYPIS